MSRINVPRFFAWRYLFSKKSHSVINIISTVSAVTIAIPTMAMVVLLSVFNGLSDLLKNSYKDFDPDIEIKLNEGKFFEQNEIDSEKLFEIKGVDKISYVIEENALISYNGRQYIGAIKGVDTMFRYVTSVEKLITAGSYNPIFGEEHRIVLGQGVAYALGVRPNIIEPVEILLPRSGAVSSLLPFENFSRGTIYPIGTFSLDAETDSKYMIVPIEFARKLINKGDKISSIAVKLTPKAKESKVQKQIASLVGDKFSVKNRNQQKETLYKVIVSEKWGVYFIILLVIIIASFSLTGSVVMLIIDKKKDISTIRTLGGDSKTIGRIFTYEGLLISSFGVLCGVLLGILVCLAQIKWELVELSGSTFLINAYPVDIRITDILWIIISVMAINYLIIKLTVTGMLRKLGKRNEVF